MSLGWNASRDVAPHHLCLVRTENKKFLLTLLLDRENSFNRNNDLRILSIFNCSIWICIYNSGRKKKQKTNKQPKRSLDMAETSDRPRFKVPGGWWATWTSWATTQEERTCGPHIARFLCPLFIFVGAWKNNLVSLFSNGTWKKYAALIILLIHTSVCLHRYPDSSSSHPSPEILLRCTVE